MINRFVSTALALGLALAAPAALATDCPAIPDPIGGSESSVGISYPEALALGAFAASIEVSGQKDLLARAGFCPITHWPEARLLESDCLDPETHCAARYRLTHSYHHPRLGERTVVATFDWDDSWTPGPGRDGFLSVQELPLRGLGRKVALAGRQAAIVFDAMSADGITPDNWLVGHTELVAGRLTCSSPVVPRPVVTCAWTLAGETREVADADTAARLHEILRGLGAVQRPPVMGAVNTAAALVKCGRVVYPNAPTECTLVIEN